MNMAGPLPFDGKRWVASATLLVFLTSLLFSLFHMWHTPDDDTPPEHYAEALRSVAADLQAGDRVLIQPPWREDVWQTISSSVRLPAGVEVNTALSLPHGAALHRVWVLHDQSTPLPRAFRRRRNEAQIKQVGDVEIIFFTSSAKSTTGRKSLDGLLSSAEVSVVDADGKETQCSYRANVKRHVCPGLPEWMYVGEYEVIADGESHGCIWNHPTSGGRVVTRFRQVELPQGFAISHALSDRAASMSGGAAVELRVRVDGREVANLSHANRKGWLTDAVRLENTPALRSSKLGDVEVEVQTTTDGMRHFCWSIKALEDAR